MPAPTPRRLSDAQRLDFARTRMAESRAQLARVESLVEGLWAAGEPEAAAAWAQIGAAFAYGNHPGVYASPRLERVLGEIGRAQVPGRRRERPGAVRRVLHVLTEAYDTGGHTRLAWRWIQRDAGREHAVVLTNPGSRLPDQLRDAAPVHRLPALDLLGRARALRDVADGFDAVVLHHHMHDVVPAIALADRPDGPVTLLSDHADHVFWLGTGVSDVLVNGRRNGLELAWQRRAIERERCALLPIGVQPVQRAMTREHAKRALGLDPEQTVLLTIAMPYKLAPVLTPGFLDVVTPVLDRHPDAVLVAVGPEATGEWARPGIRAVGVQTDIRPHLCAADVYLDSYPFSSNTSLIEAAGHGVPVVAFSPDPARHGILRSGNPALGDLLVEGRSPADYAAKLEATMADAAALGERSREANERVHGGAGRQARLEDAYALALDAGPAPLWPPARREPRPAEFEAVQALMFFAAGHGSPLAEIARGHAAAGVLPAGFADVRLPDAPLARPPWDAVAAPGAGDAGELLRALAAVHAEHELDRVVLTVAPADVAAAVPGIEAALAEHADLTVDLVPADDPADLLAFGRVAVAQPGTPLAQAARRRGLAVIRP